MPKPPTPAFRPARLREQRFSVAFEYPVAFCRGALELTERTLAWAISRREPERSHPLYAVLDAGKVALIRDSSFFDWLDARYAERKGLLAPAALERVCRLLEGLGLTLYHPALSAKSAGKLAIGAGLQEFREHLGGRLSITLLSGVGSSVEVSKMDEREIADAVCWLEERGLRSCA